MPSDYTEILEFDQFRRSSETPFMIYRDLESFIEKNDGCKYNSEKLSTVNVREHFSSGFSVSTIPSFK